MTILRRKKIKVYIVDISMHVIPHFMDRGKWEKGKSKLNPFDKKNNWLSCHGTDAEAADWLNITRELAAKDGPSPAEKLHNLEAAQCRSCGYVNKREHFKQSDSEEPTCPRCDISDPLLY